MKVKSLSRVRLLATPWTAAYQAPLSMGFSYNPSNLSEAYFVHNFGSILPKPACFLSQIHVHTRTYILTMISESLVLITIFLIPLPLLKFGIMLSLALSNKM